MTDTDTLMGRYPHIRFATQWRIEGGLEYALGQCDAMVDAISLAPLLPRFRQALHLLSMRKGAQATTAIEGNTLSDEEIERVALGESLPPSQAYQQREVENILAAFNSLLAETVAQNHADLISPALLLRFHEMIGRELGEHFAAIPGTFAQSQRIVGPYRAPSPEDVPSLVEKLCEWLQREFHYPRQRFSDAVVQAIVTHVYIEWIHPFDDGNGRTGRLVEFYILMRAGLPSIASHLLANHYNNTRPEYYRQLQRARQERDISAFLMYAVTGLRDGLVTALHGVQQNALEQMWRVLVYDAFGKRPIGQRVAFTRQREVALSLPLDRAIRFSEIKELTPFLTEAYVNATPRKVLRDLSELAKLDLILREPGLIRANRALLDGTLPNRRKTAAAEASSQPVHP
jgi:Fic family protein